MGAKEPFIMEKKLAERLANIKPEELIEQMEAKDKLEQGERIYQQGRKAGIEQERARLNEEIRIELGSKAFEKGKQAGISSTAPCPVKFKYVQTSKLWQAQKEEWGIKPKEVLK